MDPLSMAQSAASIAIKVERRLSPTGNIERCNDEVMDTVEILEETRKTVPGNNVEAMAEKTLHLQIRQAKLAAQNEKTSIPGLKLIIKAYRLEKEVHKNYQTVKSKSALFRLNAMLGEEHNGAATSTLDVSDNHTNSCNNAESCGKCNKNFKSAKALETHMAATGHY